MTEHIDFLWKLGFLQSGCWSQASETVSDSPNLNFDETGQGALLWLRKRLVSNFRGQEMETEPQDACKIMTINNLLLYLHDCTYMAIKFSLATTTPRLK